MVHINHKYTCNTIMAWSLNCNIISYKLSMSTVDKTSYCCAFRDCSSSSSSNNFLQHPAITSQSLHSAGQTCKWRLRTTTNRYNTVHVASPTEILVIHTKVSYSQTESQQIPTITTNQQYMQVCRVRRGCPSGVMSSNLATKDVGSNFGPHGYNDQMYNLDLIFFCLMQAELVCYTQASAVVERRGEMQSVLNSLYHRTLVGID